MQFSIRTLLIACVIVAIPFGAIGIYNSMWEAHCRRLETSLYRTILQEVIDYEQDRIQEFEHEGVAYNSEPVEIYWALTTEDGFASPPPELIKEVGLSSVLPSSEAGHGQYIHFIKNIRWVDWETVIVDRGSFSYAFYSGGIEDQKLKYSDGEWQVVEPGDLYIN